MIRIPLAMLTILIFLECGAAESKVLGIKVPDGIEDLDAIAFYDDELEFTFKKWYSAFFFQGMQRYDDSRLGYSLSYASPAGTDISIYVYDYGLSSIPNGIENKVVLNQFSKSMRVLSDSGRYATVEEEKIKPLSEHFLQAYHSIELKNGVELKSYTLLRGQNGRFIKIRITGRSEVMEARVRSFLVYALKDMGLVLDSASLRSPPNE